MLQVNIVQGHVEKSYPFSATHNSININTPIQSVICIIQFNYFKTPFLNLMSVGYIAWREICLRFMSIAHFVTVFVIWHDVRYGYKVLKNHRGGYLHD